MFQKIKPVHQTEKKEDDTKSSASNDTTEQKPTTASSTTDSQEKKTMSDSKKDNDVELDGLTKRSETGAYSPRPAATTSAGFSSFPGARSNNTESTSTTSKPTPVASDRQLLIGKGINISGEIDACNHLVVEGQVDATLKGANILDIAESGTFYGSVEINEGSVAGRFEGDLKVEGRLTIRSTGVIIGSLQYGELAVEAGATIEGKISPLSSKAATRSSNTSSSKSSSSASKSTTNTVKKTVSMDNELPFATKAS